MEINDHVICIDDRFHPDIAKLYTALPVRDQQYVIRDVLIGKEPTAKGMRGCVRLLLVGLHNPLAGKSPSTERGFSSERFRKLNEMKEHARTPMSQVRSEVCC